MKKILLINLVIFFFLITILEFIPRLLNLSSLGGMESRLFYTKEGTHYLTPNTEGLVFGKKVYTDEYGYRVPNRNFRYNNLKKVFIIGDSTTFGNGVEEKKTFVGLLRNNFLKIDFVNSAVPGYQLKQYNKNLKNIKKINNIDKIIYVITLNDVFSSSNVVDTKNSKNNYNESSDDIINILKNIKIISKLNLFLRNKSYLYMYIKGIFSDPSRRWYLNIDKFYNKNKINHLPEFVDNLLKETEKDLHVITLPYEYQTRNCTAKDLVPQDKIQNLLKDKTIFYHDFTKYFCDLDNPKDYFRKFDPMHLSLLGHKLVYNLIKNEINF
jgi:hypothetical protein